MAAKTGEHACGRCFLCWVLSLVVTGFALHWFPVVGLTLVALPSLVVCVLGDHETLSLCNWDIEVVNCFLLLVGLVCLVVAARFVSMARRVLHVCT